jgi:PTH2 family peptidyl-tRNA hydrolase
MDTKQVIVIRKDLKMRKGKMVAQATHATKLMLLQHTVFDDNGFRLDYDSFGIHREAIKAWINGMFTTTVVSVDSEADFLEVERLAKERELVVAKITDAGKTEFHGIPTLTALSIGPAKVDAFIGVTDHLKLL